MLILNNSSHTVGLALVTWPFRLLMMYCRSSSEMNRCSAGVLLVRIIHNIIVNVDVIPTRHTYHRLLVADTVQKCAKIRIVQFH